MTFKNILVAYDMSPYSNRAFKTALEIAKTDDSKITLLTIIPGEYSAIMGYSQRNSQVIQKQKKVVMQYAYKLEAIAKKSNVPISVKIKQGTSISKEIINMAKSQRASLIVLGSHGRTGIKKVILGSVANGVVQQAKISVLVVK